MKNTFIISAIVVTFISVLLIFVTNMVLKEKLSIDCYLYDPCGGCFAETGPCKPCVVEREYIGKYNKLLEDNKLARKVKLNVYNVLYPFYNSMYLNRLIETGAESAETYPIIFIDDKYFIKDEQIEDEMIEYIKQNTTILYTIKRALNRVLIKDTQPSIDFEIKDEISYFSSEYCSECKKVDELFYKTSDDNIKKISKKIEKYDISDEKNMQLLKLTLEQYGTDVKEITVPTVFINNNCLVGYDEIADYFDSIQGESKINSEVP